MIHLFVALVLLQVDQLKIGIYTAGFRTMKATRNAGKRLAVRARKMCVSVCACDCVHIPHTTWHLTINTKVCETQHITLPHRDLLATLYLRCRGVSSLPIVYTNNVYIYTAYIIELGGRATP